MVCIDDVHYFDNISDFINTVENAKRIQGRGNASEDEDSSFTKTNSIDEAWKMIKSGDTSVMKDYDKDIVKVDLDNVRPKQRLDVVGHNVNVPLYLIGVPTCMIRKDNKIFKNKIVNILVNNSVGCFTSTDSIIKMANDIFGKILAIENMGYRVNIYKMIGSSSRNGDVLGFIKMKNDRERINLKKMVFPMCHPSMQRRLDFKFRECFGKNDVTHDGYGRQSDWNKEYVTRAFKHMCREDFIFINMHNYDDKWDNVIK